MGNSFLRSTPGLGKSEANTGSKAAPECGQFQRDIAHNDESSRYNAILIWNPLNEPGLARYIQPIVDSKCPQFSVDYLDQPRATLDSLALFSTMER